MKNFPALPFMGAETFSSTTQHSFCLICNFIALYNICSVWLKNSISEYFSYAIPWNPKSQISSNYCLSKSNLNIFSLNTVCLPKCFKWLSSVLVGWCYVHSSMERLHILWQLRWHHKEVEFELRWQHMLFYVWLIII